MGQEVLLLVHPNAKILFVCLLLVITIATVSARPQFFPAESVESTEDDEIEGRHFFHRRPYNHRRPFTGHRPFVGPFSSFSGGGLPNSGPFSPGVGNFGPSGQFFGPNIGGGAATALGFANTGNGGGSAIGFGSAGNGGGQATGVGIAQAPLGGFGMGVGLAVATPFGNIAQGQGFSLG
ncbi:glycine-rich protein 23 [Daphnia magna]|uniref:Uncharacterized protein n=2 Tax=Daphnia magna TaxID=35525 RepID=A0A0P6A4I5_9CRUS|nr:glycine-rich protein 23 [Daphnia magna]KAK4035655.1 hypothetical protein OUZ56_027741 [Daphnia magna]KZS12964.1 Uncharacterized protein APZ42_022251 [Daphnia magna]